MRLAIWFEPGEQILAHWHPPSLRGLRLVCRHIDQFLVPVDIAPFQFIELSNPQAGEEPDREEGQDLGFSMLQECRSLFRRDDARKFRFDSMRIERWEL